MAEKYFEKFPLINYGNNVVRDVTARAVIMNNVFINPNLFYPYDITDGVRPDQLSDSYYNDEYMSWIIYLSNKMIDPYYDWYLNDEQFNKYMFKKYGLPLETLQRKVTYYINNWYRGDDITQSDFNALPAQQKKYYGPVYGTNGKVISYSRLKKDWKLNTNYIVAYECSGANAFIKDEIIKIHFNTGLEGKAQVASANDTHLTVQHVSGYVYPSNSNPVTANSYVRGEQSRANTSFTAVLPIADVIPEGEESYWDAVHIYDDEMNKNEFNKSIVLIDNRYSMQMSKNLTNLMK